MAKFRIGSPAYIKPIGLAVEAVFPAGSIVEVPAEFRPAKDWTYIEGSGPHLEWQPPAPPAPGTTDVEKEAAAWDAKGPTTDAAQKQRELANLGKRVS